MNEVSQKFLLTPSDTVLALVDVQEKLVPAFPPDVIENVIRNITILIKGVNVFNIPVLTTEQYSKGLGKTIPPLRQILGDQEPIEKIMFSSYRADDFRSQLEAHKAHSVILCGMETHVCLLQTAYDLLNAGYRVFVASDACCSRVKSNWKTGLHLMRDAGAVIGSTEAFLFQMLQSAGSPEFKQISALVK